MEQTKRAPKRIPIDYMQGKIYKIVNNVNDMVYIDGTTTSLARRMCSDKVLKIKEHVDRIGSHNFQVVLIENFPCKNKDELTARAFEVRQAYAQDKLWAPPARKQKSVDQTFLIHDQPGKTCYYIQWERNGERNKETFSYRVQSKDNAMAEAQMRQAELRVGNAE